MDIIIQPWDMSNISSFLEKNTVLKLVKGG